MTTKKIIDTYEEASEFTLELSKDNKAVAAVQLEDGRFEVQWAENKKYIAQDGQEYTEEVWLTKENEMIFIQDLTEEHAKNIIRMLLRNERESIQQVQQMKSQILDALAGLTDEMEGEQESEDTPPKGSYLH